MADTTIGYAVLQIIPSLKGVSEAINKQISGQVVAVTIEPKTDAAKVDKSIKDAVKKKPVEVPITPKVDQKQLDQELKATKDKILKGAKDWDSFNKATAEKWAKIRQEEAEKAKAAAAAAAKAAAAAAKPPAIQIDTKIDADKVVDQVTEAVKKAGQQVKSTKLEIPQFDPEQLRGIGTKLRDAAADGLREINNNPTLKRAQDQLGEAIGEAIGEKIGKALADSPVGEFVRNVAEQAQNVVETVQTVTGSLATIKQGDAAGGLEGIAQALNNIGQTGAGTKVHEIANEVAPLQEKFGGLRDNIKGSTDNLLSLTNNSGRISGGLNAIAGAAGPLAATFIALDNLMPGFDQHLQNIMKDGGNFKDWISTMFPAMGIADKIAAGIAEPFAGPNRFQSPVPAKPGVSGIPLPGMAPAFELPAGADVPPGTTYTATPGSLSPVPTGVAAPGGPSVPMPVPVPVVPVPVLVPPKGGAPSLADLAPLDLPGRAGGGLADVINGLVRGPGTGTSDSILGFPAGVRVSNGEFITNEEGTRRNLPLLQAVNSGVPLWDWLKQIPRFDGGGLVAGSEQLRQIIQQRFGIPNIGGYRPGGDGFNEHSTGRALDVMVGNDKAKGDAVKDFALANAAAIDLKWLIWRQHLYYPGGGGYDMDTRANGDPTQNHMDHVHIFSGPGIVNGLLGALQGSAAPKGKGDDAGSPAALSDALAGTGAAAAAPAAGVAAAAASSSGGFTLPTSFSDLAGFGLNGLGAGVGTTGSGSDLSLFGNAAASAVSGQVSSALGAFGVPGAPRWLGGISQLLSGISIGGVGGGGVSPLSAAIPSSLATAAPAGPAALPNDVHSVGAGQRPGPQTVFNIQTARVEDAFVRADRLAKEKAAAKTDRLGWP